MRHHRKAICLTCKTELAYYADPWHLWVHTELPLGETAGHAALPDPNPPDESYDWALGRPFQQIEEA